MKIFFSLNKSLRALLGINLIFVFAQALLGPLYAVYIQQRVGGDVLSIGWAFAVYVFTIGTVSLFASRLADRQKEKEYFIIFGYLARTVGFLCYIFVGSIAQLLILQFALGIIEAISSPAYNSIYSIHLDKKKETSEWGVDSFYTHWTIGLATILGALVVKFFGFNILFVLMSLMSFAAFLFMLTLPRKLL